jgi:hypothetical protein
MLAAYVSAGTPAENKRAIDNLLRYLKLGLRLALTPEPSYCLGQAVHLQAARRINCLGDIVDTGLVRRAPPR